MEITQETQKKILVKLMHNPQLTYNQLWNKEGESNKFNYHLKKLVKDNLITKNADTYKLTIKGKKIVTHLDGETGNTKHKPVVCSFIVGYKPETNEILVHVRRKEPFYGYVGIPGGKIDFGNSPIQTARDEFLEETGLEGKMQLRIVANFNTFNENELMHHLIGFIYLCNNPTGSLIESNREGENKWIKLEDLKKQNHYPDIGLIFNETLRKSEVISFMNLERTYKDNSFIDLKALNEF